MNAKQRLKPGKQQRDFLTKSTFVNLNTFRIARTKARRTINQRKRKSWKNYVSNLNTHSLINKVWTAIRKIKCKDTAEKYKHLKLVNHIYTDKKEISNIIGQTISKKSSKDNLSHKFIAYKIHKKKNS